jgi:hypothetical protein
MDYIPLDPEPPQKRTQASSGSSSSASEIAFPSDNNDSPSTGTPVVAIDFGTTRTATAYGFMGNDTEVTMALVNGGSDADLQQKSETTLIMEKNPDGSFQAVEFGVPGKKTYQMNETLENARDLYLFERFKMRLPEVKSDADETVFAEDVKGRRVSLLIVMTEALRFMSRVALELLQTQGIETTMDKIYWIITVPAIWSPSEAGFMRRAAFKAGMIPYQLCQHLTLLREPESACLDLLNRIESKTIRVNIPIGAQVLVLDLGGGTNDTTFVKIEGPRRCGHIKAATGGKYGATVIDLQLIAILTQLFGDERMPAVKANPHYIDRMEAWENYKVNFDGKPKKMGHRLILSALIEDYNSKNKNRMISDALLDEALIRINDGLSAAQCITRDNRNFNLPVPLITTWFDQVIDGITAGLERDLADPACRTLEYVYLVGGFSANVYTYERIKAFIGAQNAGRSPKLTLFRATKPDIAIIRGAVFSRLRSGAQSMVTRTIARYTYGFSYAGIYDSDVHSRSNKYLAADGRQRVNLYMGIHSTGR